MEIFLEVGGTVTSYTDIWTVQRHGVPVVVWLMSGTTLMVLPWIINYVLGAATFGIFTVISLMFPWEWIMMGLGAVFIFYGLWPTAFAYTVLLFGILGFGLYGLYLINTISKIR